MYKSLSLLLFRYKTCFISYYTLTAANDSLNTEIREIMCTMDKLRNNLYKDFRPQIKMLEELQINDEIMEPAHSLVATKKVTQVRVAPSSLLQDNQLEVLAIEPLGTKEIIVPNLPPTGPLVKRSPQVDDVVYIMKSPVMPWIKAKVCRIFIASEINYIFFSSVSRLKRQSEDIKEDSNTRIFRRYKILFRQLHHGTFA